MVVDFSSNSALPPTTVAAAAAAREAANASGPHHPYYSVSTVLMGMAALIGAFTLVSFAAVMATYNSKKVRAQHVPLSLSAVPGREVRLAAQGRAAG